MSPPYRPKNDGWEIRTTIGTKKRLSVFFRGTEKQCAFRTEAIGVAVAALVKAGHLHDVKRTAKRIAEAPTVDEVREIVERAQKSTHHSMAIAAGTTIKELADMWLNGELRKRFRDQVPQRKKKVVDGDRARFDAYILPLVGDVPVTAFRHAHGQSVMAELPEHIGPCGRRAIAQALRRILRFAVQPLGLLEFNPLPTGFLPLIPKSKAKSYLYPDEDAKLLAASEEVIPVVRRIFWGSIAREGFRPTEALSLAWVDVDFEHGTINLEKNKTNDPRMWKGSEDTMAALKYLHDAGHKYPFEALGLFGHPAERLRSDLTAVGVTRPALFNSSASRVRMRAHDLRATFVTTSIAAGKTENWISRRTGHKSHEMIKNYTREAENLLELSQGPLLDMRDIVPELRRGLRGDRKRKGTKKGGGKK